GRTDSGPADRLDAAIVAAVNQHQRTDKGFGPALGPAAGSAAIAQLQSMNYSLVHGTSDWVLGPDEREMQMKIFASWASAACAIGSLSHADTVAWLARRRDAVIAGCSCVRVGHVDFVATPVQALGASRAIDARRHAYVRASGLLPEQPDRPQGSRWRRRRRARNSSPPDPPRAAPAQIRPPKGPTGTAWSNSR